ncbi:hypothetical protein GCM10027535_52700 [Mycolicibacterium hippocampi]|uniref:Uncharacterized protein n=1 Tax=Mycolicibacterium hippocampi TaxID=659824 RepID=A0A7I9ZVQ1_9MYCO|nr:hypothetical protein MHIP_53100 [Mycolicibacterium hippocampi]
MTASALPATTISAITRICRAIACPASDRGHAEPRHSGPIGSPAFPLNVMNKNVTWLTRSLTILTDHIAHESLVD